MGEVYFPSSCSSKSPDWSLWSPKIGWDTPDPDITLCFQYTILNWVPLLFLWVSCSIYIPIIWKRGNVIQHRIGKFNIFKSTLIALLLLIHIVNLCKTIGETLSKLPPPPAMYLQPVLSAISSILLIYLNRLIFLKGIHTSGVLFFYWLLQFVANLMIIYSRCRRLKLIDRDIFRTVTATLEFALVLASFISNCIADQAVFEELDLSVFVKGFDESRPLISSSFHKESTRHAPDACSESRVSFLSQITYFWNTKLMLKGYRNPLTFEDMYTLPEENTCHRIIPKIDEGWNKELESVRNRKKKPVGSDLSKINYQKLEDENSSNKNQDLQNKASVTPSFTAALFHTIAYTFITSGFLKLFYDLFPFVQAFLLGLLIQFMENPNDYAWHGYLFSICIFICVMAKTVTGTIYFYQCCKTGLTTKTAITGIIYRKVLKLFIGQKNASNGEIMNLMTVDSRKIQDVFLYVHSFWSVILFIFIAITYLWVLMGPSVLAGFAFLIILTPVNVIIATKMKNLQIKQMKIKDRRMKLINEVFSGMKIVKLYSWENTFQRKILEIRNEECDILQAIVYLYSIISVMWFCAPFLVSFLTFGTYLLSSPSNILTVYKAAISLTIFGIISTQLQFLPDTIFSAIQTKVSLQRINKFLLLDELDPATIEEALPQESPLKIINGSFSWEKNGLPVLKDINIDIEQGSLIAVVGTVGSGKTSLVSALIGEMFKLSGKVKCRGSVAYVPQQAWCLNASVKDNILFNKPMNAYKYKRVIAACALLEDLKIFPFDDETEIGERGINLSGGQKQRISLARAVYQDSSIYILDDPLSAVDPHVGKHIFHQVIGPNGLLSDKTRVLITHGLTYLPKVDKIFVMRDLIISESGSFEELLNNNGPFAELIETYLEQDDEEAEMSDDEDKYLMKSIRQKIPRISGTSSFSRQSSMRSSVSEKSTRAQKVEENDKLIQEEFVETSGVKCSVYLTYIRSATYLVAISALIFYILYMGFCVGSNVFLSIWTQVQYKNVTQGRFTLKYFVAVYGGLGAGQVIFILIQNLSLAYGTVSASKTLHNNLLTSILRAPAMFFDTTPVGRILNRMGRDIDTVDVHIYFYIRYWLIGVSALIGSIVFLIIAFPYSIIALIPLTFIYIMFQKLYIASSRQITRLEAIKRSPIYSHFQESLAGASSIRVFNVLNTFIDKCDALTDENQKVLYSSFITMRWLQLILESIGNVIILLACILTVVTRSIIGPGFAALSVSLSLQISWTLNHIFRMICELETSIVSVERIQEYIDVEHEAPWSIEETKPDPDWPAKGEIDFVNYSVRYRPGLDLVLRGLNFVVHAGEKLGIVGRTGAGKSSLVLGLFRLIEPAEGSIFIDGINISKIGLHSLRSKISIIPQDPVLFSGTLRMNLDPFDEYSDDQLWDVLEMAHLKSFVIQSDEGLNFPISDRGENLSVGQKQLVSLARVLLRRTKILVLDEATSAIDNETDDLIQRSIRDHFHDCTVLTIAHRINTIIDYDRVLVLQRGKMRELDSPQNLLRNTRSTFYNMAKDAGML